MINSIALNGDELFILDKKGFLNIAYLSYNEKEDDEQQNMEV